MSDSPGLLTPLRHELFDFHGDQLIAVVLEAELLPGDPDAVAPRQETLL